jgi:hypothetical protein
MQPHPLALSEKLKNMGGESGTPILTLLPNYNRSWHDDLAAANISYETPTGRRPQPAEKL